jgi:sigma-B regulation protein RsbU (phosphoserine phosphatase)
MAESSSISMASRIRKLENELNLKQLQLKSLLAITQAINDNISADGLYNMYKTFVNWDMRVNKMAFFIRENDVWICPATINIDYDIAKPDLVASLHKYRRLQSIDEAENGQEILNEFDIVIPVYHKDYPLSFTLIGGFEEEEDVFNRVQFIQTITNVITVAIENKRLFREQLEQERLKQSMFLASEVQKMFIPDSLPKESRFELDSIYQPHFNVGGDYFDYFRLNDNEFLFCIADVSGKGVGAAMVMANFQALLRTMLLKYVNLGKLVKELNRAVYATTKSDKFITLFIAKVNLRKNNIQYINAGHCAPLLCSDTDIRFLESSCTILGAQPDFKSLESKRISYLPGTLIMCYTDGLSELRNDAGEYFDEDHVRAFGYMYKDYSAHEFNHALLNRLNKFKEEQKYMDDIAVLTCRLK